MRKLVKAKEKDKLTSTDNDEEVGRGKRKKKVKHTQQVYSGSETDGDASDESLIYPSIPNDTSLTGG